MLKKIILLKCFFMLAIGFYNAQPITLENNTSHALIVHLFRADDGGAELIGLESNTSYEIDCRASSVVVTSLEEKADFVVLEDALLIKIFNQKSLIRFVIKDDENAEFKRYLGYEVETVQ